MAWNDTLEKQPETAKQVWLSNDDIWQAWESWVSSRGAPNTRRNLLSYTGAFFDCYDIPVTSLAEEDMDAYISRLEIKCAHLMNGRPPNCLGKQEIETCPNLYQDPPFTSCAGYRPLKPSAVWSHITSINRLYSWLLEKQRVTGNPMLGPMRDFRERHKDFFEEKGEAPDRRPLEDHEVQALVRGCPPGFATAIFLMCKYFLRIHEVLSLTWDAKHSNLGEGWLKVPRGSDFGGKRRGNRLISLDSEGAQWMRTYRAQWDANVQRDADNIPVTDRIILTYYGKPYTGEYAIRNFNTALHKHSVRLGLMTGEETESGDRVNTHCFRSWATTKARAAGADDASVEIMRGDLGRNPVLARYDNYHARLPELYARYGPQIGV